MKKWKYLKVGMSTRSTGCSGRSRWWHLLRLRKGKVPVPDSRDILQNGIRGPAVRPAEKEDQNRPEWQELFPWMISWHYTSLSFFIIVWFRKFGKELEFIAKMESDREIENFTTWKTKTFFFYFLFIIHS